MAIKIFIDQGHNANGANAGAEGNGLREQDVTFVVGMKLYEILQADPRFEARVSRETIDTNLGTSNATSLQKRVQMANSWPANYFISIHCNASVNSSVHGTESLVYSEYSQSYWLGEHILNAVTARMGTLNRGVILRPGLYVLRRTNMPAVLVELAFITNYEDAQLLKNDPDGFAYGIYNGLLTYFDFEPIL